MSLACLAACQLFVIGVSHSQAAQELESFDYSTGDAAADGRARSLVRALLRPDHPLVSSATSAQVCQKGFDERKLFQTAGNGDFKGGPIGGGFNPWSRGAGNPRDLTSSGLEGRFGGGFGELLGGGPLGRAEAAVELRGEFQARFRNISRIMDCVGCEKCRLWGKLQVSTMQFKLPAKQKLPPVQREGAAGSWGPRALSAGQRNNK